MGGSLGLFGVSATEHLPASAGLLPLECSHSLSLALFVFLRAEFKTHSLCASLPRHVPIPAPRDSISLGLCFLLWEMEEYRCPSHRVAMTRQGTRTSRSDPPVRAIESRSCCHYSNHHPWIPDPARNPVPTSDRTHNLSMSRPGSVPRPTLPPCVTLDKLPPFPSLRLPICSMGTRGPPHAPPGGSAPSRIGAVA